MSRALSRKQLTHCARDRWVIGILNHWIYLHFSESFQQYELLWRSAKQVGVQIVVPRTRYQVYGKKQAGRFSPSEQKRIDHEKYLLLYLRTYVFFFYFLWLQQCLPVSASKRLFQETRFSQSEQKRIDREKYLFLYLCKYFFFFHLLFSCTSYCMPISASKGICYFRRIRRHYFYLAFNTPIETSNFGAWMGTRLTLNEGEV